METVVLNLETVNLTDEQFYHLCQANQTWNLERNQKGELLIMPPVGGNSGNREADLIADVTIWNRQSNSGKVFSSSTIFRLPNGGDRSPDVAWIKRERWEALSAEEREKFAILSGEDVLPGFVLNLT
ncbi:MAG: Uma2 family endonuclease [Microcystis aeruginosa K13-06]|nr:Uma2 family endonuclease [Microcystis aeruginosa K13-06]